MVKRGRPSKPMPGPIRGVDPKDVAHRVLNSRRRRRGEWKFNQKDEGEKK